ncbi:inhibitory POU protein-like, partial [Diaphorina citri]|uniref:Inhibitory POU protein-like n=1 Tax=Diaphorina citri TaxID=121845 RepID=A0A1S3DFJ9_DIACI
MSHHGMDGLEMLDSISSSMTTLTPMSDPTPNPHQLHSSSMYGPSMNSMMTGHHHHHHHSGALPASHHHGATHHPVMPPGLQHPDTDTDPRELEAFAERFKQRRIKLGTHSCTY